MKSVKHIKIYRRSRISAGGAAFLLTCCLLILAALEVNRARAQTNSAPVDISKSINRFLYSSAVSGSKAGIEVRDAATGQVIYSHGADRQLVPASNVKIVTIATAMALLRPDYKYRTEVLVDGLPRKGTVFGNMYLKGYGDPSLVDEQLWTLARDIAYRGVIEIKGKIIADDSYFDRNYYGEGWGKIEDDPYFAPISALSLNFNTFVVTANPADQVGGRPKLFYMPPDKHLQLVNRAITTGAGGSVLKVIEKSDEINSYEVVGSISAGSKALEIRRTIGDPALYTVGSFEAYLTSWGVVTSGSIDRGKTPAQARLFHYVESKPLSNILEDVGKVSSNFGAEQVVKTLCAEKGAPEEKSPATTQCGLKVIADFLEKIGIPKGGYTMMDGSGLSRSDRISAKQLNDVLMAMYGDARLWPEFAASLSIGGVDGTLEKRYLNSPLRGLVRAKTGHLNGVNALSGFVRARDGRMLVFSIIFNDFAGYHASVEEVEDNIVEAAAGY